MIPIGDFELHAPVPQATIDRYRGSVHDDVIELWQTYGFGTFGHGFFRIVDPVEHERGIGDVLGKVTGEAKAVPIMVTGLADVIAWEAGDGVTAIRYRDERTVGVGYDFDTILDFLDLDGAEYLERDFDWQPFPQALEAHGGLAFDESFVFVPLLSLGGERAVEHLRPRKTIEAIRMMVELQGVIEH